MPAPKINGFTIAYTAVGGIILWSGITGTTLSTTFKDLLSGQAPTQNQEQIQAGASLASDTTTTGTSSSSSSTATVPSGPGSSSGVTALKKAAAQYGWDTGAEWQALNFVEMREAGYSLTATNPTSGAYGMAQFIDGPSEYATYGGNSTTYDGQAVAMVNYIKQRYGDPIAAANHEKTDGWY